MGRWRKIGFDRANQEGDMKGVNMICPNCKSSRLVKRTDSQWSIYDQQWRQDSCDVFFCEACCMNVDGPEVVAVDVWTIADAKP